MSSLNFDRQSAPHVRRSAPRVLAPMSVWTFSRPQPRWWVLCLAALGLLLGACGDEQGTASGATDDAAPRQVSGVVRDPAPDVSSLELPEASGGSPFRFQARAGHLLLAYFGYTSCPDVCPTTLADLKVALRKLGSGAESVDLAMATIDPRRDTAEIITGYVTSFIPGATALRTEDDAALRSVTNGFGASYEVDYSDPTVPEVAHSGFVYVVDDTGRLVLEWPFGTSSDDIAKDLEQLLDRSS